MLRNLKDIENYAISASDGLIGHIKDFYFDDESWVIRYFVVDTGTWLSSRKVLISPVAVHDPNWLDRTLAVSLTREQVRNSPPMDSDQPISRQNEGQYLDYYGYPAYWGGGGIWAEGFYPYAMAPGYDGRRIERLERERDFETILRAERESHRNDDPHLRSCDAVRGYRIQATDGEIGHVAGYVVDDASWSIRGLVIDTSNWWLGHKVLIAPTWIDAVHWSDQTVSVALDRAWIENAPHFDDSLVWTREQELSLHRQRQSNFTRRETAAHDQHA